MSDFVTIAILAKDKAHVLPLYLKCISDLTYPKSKIYLYIKTNDNTDNTDTILQRWIENISNPKDITTEKYASIYFNNDNVNEILKKYKPHEWNNTRFKILAKIRQDSIEYAISKNSNYFVIDVDNFVKKNTLSCLIETNKSVVGPLLKNMKPNSLYSNYHESIDDNGYFKNSNEYYNILNQTTPGIHKVNVIHCTLYIKNDVLPSISYFDNTNDYEYVIFSRNLRKLNIEQHIDNREIYGYLTFTDDAQAFSEECALDNTIEKHFL